MPGNNCILWKLHAWFSSSGQKWLSAYEILVFFNCQYFIIIVISDFDFWLVNGHEWKEQGLLTGFQATVTIESLHIQDMISFMITMSSHR